jgi:hypothetical protein
LTGLRDNRETDGALAAEYDKASATAAALVENQ